MSSGVRLRLGEIAVVVVPLNVFPEKDKNWVSPIAVINGKGHAHQPCYGAVADDVGITVEIGFKQTDIAK
jgi:hypothetical protein